MSFTFYDWKKNGRGDFFGGLNAAVLAIPLAIAFGVESGLGAAAGLIGAFVSARWFTGRTGAAVAKNEYYSRDREGATRISFLFRWRRLARTLLERKPKVPT